VAAVLLELKVRRVLGLFRTLAALPELRAGREPELYRAC